MDDTIAVAELAKKMAVQGREIVKKLWALGMMGVTINQDIDLDTATLIANEFGFQIESTAFNEEEVLTDTETADNPEDVVPRAPVVTIMGHVDHGKTSLLDAIRKANVAAGEAGGITQHIGAYKVAGEKGDVVFLDTPGHEAFTAMRARGAQMTDIVVLVVAADDGPMPQTIEAINHAKEAQVPIVVAINKIDKPGANPDLIRNKLSEHELVSEEWGGTTIFVNVSAKTKEGIDKLLEMLALQAELLELKANPNKPAKGHVIEARLDRARGPISTILVEDGTLKLGDLVVAGEYSGRSAPCWATRVRRSPRPARRRRSRCSASTACPTRARCSTSSPTRRRSSTLVEHRHDARRKKELAAGSSTGRVSLENILDKIKSGEVKEVKVDPQGRRAGLGRGGRQRAHQAVDRVGGRQRHLHRRRRHHRVRRQPGQGLVGDRDRLQRASGRQGAAAGRAGGRRHQALPGHLRRHRRRQEGHGRHAGADLAREAARQGRGPPGLHHPQGRHHRRLLRHRGEDHAARRMLRLVRDSVVIYTGKVGSLRRFKDDASEVAQGYECGLSIEGYNDLRGGDIIEAFEMETIAATLDAPKAS